MTRSDTTTPHGQVQPLKTEGGTAPVIDATRIAASVGELPYEWRIDTDVLTWGDRAVEILGVPDETKIATGRSFAQLLDAHTPVSRLQSFDGGPSTRLLAPSSQLLALSQKPASGPVDHKRITIFPKWAPLSR